jgi:hypothetical protein
MSMRNAFISIFQLKACRFVTLADYYLTTFLKLTMKIMKKFLVITACQSPRMESVNSRI